MLSAKRLVNHLSRLQMRYHKVLQARRATGVTLVEVLVSLFLITVGFTVAFEVLSEYLRIHQKNVSQNDLLLEIVSLRNFFRLHLLEGTKGLGLRGEGGATPIGRVNGTLVGNFWIEPDGKRLWVVNRHLRNLPGTLIYARTTSQGLGLLVTDEGKWDLKGVRYVSVLGLQAPSEWNALPEVPPLIGIPFQRRCFGYLAEVTNIRRAVQDDIPVSDPSLEKLRDILDFNRCLWVDCRLGTIGPLALPVGTQLILQNSVGFQVQASVRYRVVAVVGIREVSLYPDGSLRSRLYPDQEEEVILPPSRLGPQSRFSYQRSDLVESQTSPELRRIMGVTFSGDYLPDKGRNWHVIYLPFAPEDWQPFLGF